MNQIDLNCDVGEGIGNEAALMPLISSCNIACGGHAGDVETMRRVIELAAIHNVKIGAHPGYEDKESFGRVVLPLSRKQLKESIQKQIQTLRKEVETQGQRLHHVKPHGALYNKAAVNRETATAIVEVVEAFDPELILYVPYRSLIREIAKDRLNIMVEGFADRNYNNDYTLVSRTAPNALLTNPKEVLTHVVRMVNQKQIKSIQGDLISVKLDTLCVHGDTSGAVKILKYLSQGALENNIAIQ